MNWRLNKIPQFVPRVGKLPTGLCCDVHHECKVNIEWKNFSRVVRRKREREKSFFSVYFYSSKKTFASTQKITLNPKERVAGLGTCPLL